MKEHYKYFFFFVSPTIQRGPSIGFGYAYRHVMRFLKAKKRSWAGMLDHVVMHAWTYVEFDWKNVQIVYMAVR
jgi:hypothetical protein